MYKRQIVACEKIKQGTDIRFICFDRLETEAEPGYLMRVQSYGIPWKENLNEAREKANEPLVEIKKEDE